jgi:molecular chaperone GrpE (heat shock protein)
MASKGVERIEMSEGDAFDPNTQEAMSVLPCTQPEHSPGTIAAKWQVRHTQQWSHNVKGMFTV